MTDRFRQFAERCRRRFGAIRRLQLGARGLWLLSLVSLVLAIARLSLAAAVAATLGVAALVVLWRLGQGRFARLPRIEPVLVNCPTTWDRTLRSEDLLLTAAQLPASGELGLAQAHVRAQAAAMVPQWQRRLGRVPLPWQPLLPPVAIAALALLIVVVAVPPAADRAAATTAQRNAESLPERTDNPLQSLRSAITAPAAVNAATGEDIQDPASNEATPGIGAAQPTSGDPDEDSALRGAPGRRVATGRGAGAGDGDGAITNQTEALEFDLPTLARARRGAGGSQSASQREFAAANAASAGGAYPIPAADRLAGQWAALTPAERAYQQRYLEAKQ